MKYWFTPSHIKKERFTLFEEYGDIVCVKDLQKMLKIGRTTAYQLLADNKIKHTKVGRQVRIAKESIIEYLHQAQCDSDTAEQ